MALLSFDEIANTNDVTEEVISIPEWGGDVKVRALTRRQVKDITRAATKRVGKTMQIQSDVFEKGIVFYGLVHPQITEDQYEVLLEKNTAGLQKIIDAVMRLSKIGEDDEQKEDAELEEGRFQG